MPKPDRGAWRCVVGGSREASGAESDFLSVGGRLGSRLERVVAEIVVFQQGSPLHSVNPEPREQDKPMACGGQLDGGVAC